MSLRILAAIVALAGSLASTAQTTVPANPAPSEAQVSSSGKLGLLARPAKNPYGALFKSPIGRQQFPVTERPRKTVCGLTVWTVSPDLDSKAVLKPTTRSVEPKIKKIEPPVCQE